MIFLLVGIVRVIKIDAILAFIIVPMKPTKLGFTLKPFLSLLSSDEVVLTLIKVQQVKL